MNLAECVSIPVNTPNNIADVLSVNPGVTFVPEPAGAAGLAVAMLREPSASGIAEVRASSHQPESSNQIKMLDKI